MAPPSLAGFVGARSLLEMHMLGPHHPGFTITVFRHLTPDKRRIFGGTPVAVPYGICTSLKELFDAGLAETIDATLVLEYSAFAKLHGPVNATTRRRRIYLTASGADFFGNPELMLHEYCHVLLQWETGSLTVVRYLRECLRRGYWENQYEVEARNFARRHLSLFTLLLRARAVTPL